MGAPLRLKSSTPCKGFVQPRVRGATERLRRSSGQDRHRSESGGGGLLCPQSVGAQTSSLPYLRLPLGGRRKRSGRPDSTVRLPNYQSALRRLGSGYVIELTSKSTKRIRLAVQAGQPGEAEQGRIKSSIVSPCVSAGVPTPHRFLRPCRRTSRSHPGRAGRTRWKCPPA
jgi:hypothetical protein